MFDKLPVHRLGCHWIPYHQRNEDVDYAQKLKPSMIKLVDPDPNFSLRCLEWIDPNGFLVLRDWALSEQKDALARDPIGLGIAHAEDWDRKLSIGGRFANVPRDRVVICGINEPFVSNPTEISTTVNYTLAMLKRATQLGLKVSALNLSVGWPMNHDTVTVKDTPPDWGPFLVLEDAILENHGFLCVHEYFYADQAETVHNDPVVGPFGWYTHRIDMCPMRSVPIIIGEFAMNKQVDMIRWNNDGQPKIGWISNITPEQYAEQIWKYCATVNQNVFSVMPFTTDYNHDWYWTDTLQAHSAILARKSVAVWPTPYPTGGGVVVPPIEGNPMLVIFPKFTGKITGMYGSVYTNSAGVKYAHEGMDISAVTGTPIYAAYDSTVAYTEFDPAYGNYIRLYSKQLATCFFYAHLSEVNVHIGDKVTQGQLIGKSGNTGNSTGPHIHFEVRGMNADGSYYMPHAGEALYRQNGRLDPIGWMVGWRAMGGTVEER